MKKDGGGPIWSGLPQSHRSFLVSPLALLSLSLEIGTDRPTDPTDRLAAVSPSTAEGPETRSATLRRRDRAQSDRGARVTWRCRSIGAERLKGLTV